MRLILIELNEINFDAVNHYLNKGIKLPGFKQIIDSGLLTTYAEQEYKNLEPWIQWPSVHTGKTYEEHQVFRLGDFVNSSHKQIFQKIEEAGFTVGAISPMNASNDLTSPSYFIPDPWTQTPSDGSFLSKSITSAVSQAVNDNSQSKLTFNSISKLAIAFFLLVNPFRYFFLIKYALLSIRKPWRKALFLDLFLHEIHKTLFLRKNTQFSTIFLNAGAHIQHHYFYNSSFTKSPLLKNPNWYINEAEDPFLEMLKIYDYIIQDSLKMSDAEMIISTGLSQKPFTELKFYYRLKDHKKFLSDLEINFLSVVPRMTRDFLIKFDSVEDAKIAEIKLSKVLVSDGIKLFDEIDNRGKDLFVVLTYPNEINQDSYIYEGEWTSKLIDYVTFVAIKNGEHQSKGYAYFSDNIKENAPLDGTHVSNIHNSILDSFSIKY